MIGYPFQTPAQRLKRSVKICHRHRLIVSPRPKCERNRVASFPDILEEMSPFADLNYRRKISNIVTKPIVDRLLQAIYGEAVGIPCQIAK